MRSHVSLFISLSLLWSLPCVAQLIEKGYNGNRSTASNKTNNGDADRNSRLRLVRQARYMGNGLGNGHWSRVTSDKREADGSTMSSNQLLSVVLSALAAVVILVVLVALSVIVWNCMCKWHAANSGGGSNKTATSPDTAKRSPDVPNKNNGATLAPPVLGAQRTKVGDPDSDGSVASEDSWEHEPPVFSYKRQIIE